MYLSYDDELDVGRKLFDVPYRPLKLLSTGHRVYILQVDNVRKEVKSALIYDLLKNEVKPMALLPLIPTSHESSMLVVVSERKSSNYTRRIYKYDEKRNRWIERSPMQQSVVLEEALTMNGFIYTIGTYPWIHGHVRASVQVYDPSLDTWRTVWSPSNIPRVYFAAVEYQKKMFLVGGRSKIFGSLEFDVDVFSRLVEMYDPVEDEWVRYPKLPFGYSCNPMAEVGKCRLYVFDYMKPLPVSCWDGSGEWKILSDQSPLKYKYLTCFCTIEGKNVVMREMVN